jgi:opacity protein-like surface antigen
VADSAVVVTLTLKPVSKRPVNQQPTAQISQPKIEQPKIEQPTPQKTVGSAFFVMANAAYSLAPQASFGLTVGSVKKLGWYASLGSNFKFGKADYECDFEGNIIGLSSEYSYSGQKSTSRFGATAGMVFRIYDPLYAYVGGGYGFRNVFWQLENGSWAKCTDDSYQGIAIDAGFMLHFKGFGFSLGVQTIGVKYLEAKIGIGYTLKRN